ncbi:MAG TPA: type II toxin-antitoxin system RelE/ParE family toxin [Caulobacteraceae bacterium]
MRRPVQWSRHALDDLKSQIAYIAAENPPAARRVADRIRVTGAALGDTTTGRPGRVSGTYEKPVVGLPYVIAYAITALAGREVVSILRVIHSARNWPDEEWPT